MIKLIVMDVDGVIVGHKAGINFPIPSQKVLEALKNIQEKGILVVLCTGKIYYAIEPIVRKAHLNNLQIANAGAYIFDPKAGKPFKSFDMDKNLVLSIITTCLQNNLYLEVYFDDDYLVQKNQVSETTPRRTKILQKDPIIVESLLEEAGKRPISKITIITWDASHRKEIEQILNQYQEQVKLTWTIHPSTKPWEYCLITPKEVSKAHAVKEVADHLGISLYDALGIGDTLGDWIFMKLCGYAATMEDAEDELKKEVKTKGEGKYFIGPAVDEDGILSIFDYFLV